jgi:cofilin
MIILLIDAKGKNTFVILALNEAGNDLIVSAEGKKGSRPEEHKTDYEWFSSYFKPKTCCWGVIKYAYKMDDAPRDKIVLISFADDNAKIKQKMISASTTSALKETLSLVQIKLQATDESDFDEKVVLTACQKFK